MNTLNQIIANCSSKWGTEYIFKNSNFRTQVTEAWRNILSNDITTAIRMTAHTSAKETADQLVPPEMPTDDKKKKKDEFTDGYNACVAEIRQRRAMMGV